MWRKCMKNTFGAIFFWFVAMASTASFAQSICPLIPRNHHNVQEYAFGYQSWTWEESNGHIMGSCIRNLHSTRGMFVQWEGTGLSGFVGPFGGMADVLLTYRSLDNPMFDRKRRSLWYGAQPSKIDADTIIPRDSAQVENKLGIMNGSLYTGIVRVQYSNPGTDGNEKSAFTTSSVNIPDFSKVPYEAYDNTRKFLEYVEENSEILETFTMSFMSEIVAAENDTEGGNYANIMNTCNYKLPESSVRSGAGFLLLFEDSNLHYEMTGENAPFSVGGWRESNFISLRSEKVLGSSSADDVRKRETALKILSPDGKTVVATMPVAYYSDE